jgi:threonine/homoserine/homoserine lactone efflux protein
MGPYLQTILAFAGIWAITIISPGPDFVVTVKHATAGSRIHGVMAALGVAAGCAVWAIGSLLGLSVLLSEARWLYDLIRVAGALYLAYLGVKTILGAKHPLVVESAGTARLDGLDGLSALRAGLLTNLGNPKAVAFFGSLFATLFPVHAPMWVHAATLLMVFCMAAGWFSGVAWVFSIAPVASAYRKAKKWIDYVTGGIFILLGARLAVLR